MKTNIKNLLEILRLIKKLYSFLLFQDDLHFPLLCVGSRLFVVIGVDPQFMIVSTWGHFSLLWLKFEAYLWELLGWSLSKSNEQFRFFVVCLSEQSPPPLFSDADLGACLDLWKNKRLQTASRSLCSFLTASAWMLGIFELEGWIFGLLHSTFQLRIIIRLL